MENLLISLVVLYFSGMSFFAYYHPKTYKKYLNEYILTVISTISIATTTFYLGEVWLINQLYRQGLITDYGKGLDLISNFIFLSIIFVFPSLIIFHNLLTKFNKDQE